MARAVVVRAADHKAHVDAGRAEVSAPDAKRGATGGVGERLGAVVYDELVVDELWEQRALRRRDEGCGARRQR